jgi:Fe-S cluster biogenesis protein NfuA
MPDKEFDQRLKKLDRLVSELETVADPNARAAAKELVQLVMDLHGAALERILETMFSSGEVGQQLIDRLGADPLVSSLLVLYGLHPEELHTRIGAALRKVDSDLRSHGVQAELISTEDGHVRVRASVSANSCGSTAATARTLLENAIYESAPDLASVAIEGLDGKNATGFVGLEKLLNNAPSGSAHPVQAVSGPAVQTVVGD